jgi:hypothetical protein
MRIRDAKTKARVRIWTIADFVEAPMEPLQAVLDELVPRNVRQLTEAPRMADLSGFGRFLQHLRNEGMNPYLMGDFPTEPDPELFARPGNRQAQR